MCETCVDAPAKKRGRKKKSESAPKSKKKRGSTKRTRKASEDSVESAKPSKRGRPLADVSGGGAGGSLTAAAAAAAGLPLQAMRAPRNGRPQAQSPHSAFARPMRTRRQPPSNLNGMQPDAKRPRVLPLGTIMPHLPQLAGPLTPAQTAKLHQQFALQQTYLTRVCSESQRKTAKLQQQRQLQQLQFQQMQQRARQQQMQQQLRQQQHMLTDADDASQALTALANGMPRAAGPYRQSLSVRQQGQLSDVLLQRANATRASPLADIKQHTNHLKQVQAGQAWIQAASSVALPAPIAPGIAHAARAFMAPGLPRGMPVGVGPGPIVPAQPSLIRSMGHFSNFGVLQPKPVPSAPPVSSPSPSPPPGLEALSVEIHPRTAKHDAQVKEEQSSTMASDEAPQTPSGLSKEVFTKRIDEHVQLRDELCAALSQHTVLRDAASHVLGQLKPGAAPLLQPGLQLLQAGSRDTQGTFGWFLVTLCAHLCSLSTFLQPGDSRNPFASPNCAAGGSGGPGSGGSPSSTSTASRSPSVVAPLPAGQGRTLLSSVPKSHVRVFVATVQRLRKQHTDVLDIGVPRVERGGSSRAAVLLRSYEWLPFSVSVTPRLPIPLLDPAWVNSRMCSLLGYAESELTHLLSLKASSAQIYDAASRDLLKAAHDKALSVRKPHYTVKLVLLTRQGHRVPCMLSVHLEYSDRGKEPTRVVHFLQPIQ